MNTTKIKKRDGGLEDFDSAKISRVVVAAGVTPEQGKQIQKDITDWYENHPEEIITTFMIRDRIIEELKKLNPFAANLYTWYENTK